MNEAKNKTFTPLAESARPTAVTEQKAAERQRKRQLALHETLQRAFHRHAGDGPPPTRTFSEGLIVVIATYNDGRPLLDPLARINTLHHLLLTLEHQRAALPESARDNFRVVIADNGMTPNQRSRLDDYFLALKARSRAHHRQPPKFVVVPAPKIPGDEFTRTAGYARNQALREIRRRRDAGDASFDAPVLIHDDDAVTKGVGDMYRILSRHRNVLGAVAPQMQGVRDVAHHATAIRSRKHGPRRGTPARITSFPPVFDRDGLINFSVLFAFGGTRIPKTCSLLLHPRALDDLTSAHGDVFHVWKKGSFEDMCCSIGLACTDWDVFTCESSRVYDQVRAHPEARLRQQFNWAYDHATAFHDFAEVSHMLPEPIVHHGISALVPLTREKRTRQEGWGLQRMIRLTGFPGLQATIARPEEVLELLDFIHDRITTSRGSNLFCAKHRYAMDGGFETPANLAATIDLTRRAVRAVIDHLDPAKFRRIEVPFVDHHSGSTRKGRHTNHAEALRYHRDTRVARLLGNLASAFRNPMNDFPGGEVRCLALGPRQSTG